MLGLIESHDWRDLSHGTQISDGGGLAPDRYSGRSLPKAHASAHRTAPLPAVSGQPPDRAAGPGPAGLGGAD